jgi:hypothetical protein
MSGYFGEKIKGRKQAADSSVRKSGAIGKEIALFKS